MSNNYESYDESYISHGIWKKHDYVHKVKDRRGKDLYFYSEEDYQNWLRKDNPVKTSIGGLQSTGNKLGKQLNDQRIMGQYGASTRAVSIAANENRKYGLIDRLTGGDAGKMYRLRKTQLKDLRKDIKEEEKQAKKLKKRINRRENSALWYDGKKTKELKNELESLEESINDKRGTARIYEKNIETAWLQYSKISIFAMAKEKIQNGIKKVKNLLNKHGTTPVSELPESTIKRRQN